MTFSDQNGTAQALETSWTLENAQVVLSQAKADILLPTIWLFKIAIENHHV